MKDRTIEVRGCKGYDRATGAISFPIYQSATFRHPALGESTGYDYSRVKNPTREELENTVALLEKGSRCWAFSSGMAAIGALLKLFNPGDHVILSEDLYGGTVRICNALYSKYNIAFEYVNTADLGAVKKAFKDSTKAVFIETPSNPMMLVSDIKAISEFAHLKGALVIVDNTFLSPHFQKPLLLGADLVVHSGTKYLCGHNDVIAGLVIAKALPEVTELLDVIYKSEGASLGPFDSWLMLRSIKTLSVRLDRQTENALKIATWLKTVPTVTDVYYVGLPDHPSYQLSQAQTTGFGAMISFKVKTVAIAQQSLNKVKLVYFAESLGGVETLLTYPIAQTHAEAPRELLDKVGVDERLLRLSVGIEDVDDLITDLAQALTEGE
ncbi:MAG TPA: PLP-dependent transferase [Candidatus Avacidaminococcus intestinavium]|uniref:PLP-dependent transferase n=1 Tax=Candidatus Avacidaminococcus intestinavium TaxID=2840684 RepID=A0A9D1MQR4_9FIRM|nr:PLP-dependent transferase [Candidatus Avacidaminococcus intestinavium]